MIWRELLKDTFQSVIAEAPQKLDKQSSFIFLGFSMAFVQRKGASFNLKYPPLYFRVWNNIALLRKQFQPKSNNMFIIYADGFV